MKNINPQVLILSLSLAFLFLIKPLNAQDSLTIKIEELITANVQSPGPFSGSVLVAQNGKVVYKGSFGFADIEKRIKNHTNSKYFIGSITKQFTTVAILQMVDKGILSLDDTISEWLPDLPESDKITIHHLLSHQSGLPRDSHLDYNEDVSVLERIQSVTNDTLLFEPGYKEVYSNVGFHVLTHILEMKSGLKYEEYFEENIFDLAGMENTGVQKSKSEKVKKLSLGIGMKEDTFGVNDLGFAQPFNSYSFGGGGSVFSTIEDMYHFFSALENTELLSQEWVDTMKVRWPVTGESRPKFYHSYGWEVWDLGNQEEPFRVFDFTGRIYGYNSMIRYYEQDNIQIIILSNSDFSERNQLSSTIRRIIKGWEYELPNVPKKIPFSESMKKHVGIYDYPSEKTQVEIKFLNGNLALTSHGDKPIYIYPTNENEFYSNVFPLIVRFIETEDLKTQQMVWNFNEEMVNTLNRITE